MIASPAFSYPKIVNLRKVRLAYARGKSIFLPSSYIEPQLWKFPLSLRAHKPQFPQASNGVPRRFWPRGAGPNLTSRGLGAK